MAGQEVSDGSCACGALSTLWRPRTAQPHRLWHRSAGCTWRRPHRSVPSRSQAPCPPCAPVHVDACRAWRARRSAHTPLCLRQAHGLVRGPVRALVLARAVVRPAAARTPRPRPAHATLVARHHRCRGIAARGRGCRRRRCSRGSLHRRQGRVKSVQPRVAKCACTQIGCPRSGFAERTGAESSSGGGGQPPLRSSKQASKQATAVHPRAAHRV